MNFNDTSQNKDFTWEQHLGVPVERVARDLKYKGTILKIYEDTVRVNGREAKWDFIHHDGAAAVVAVNDEGKLIMVRQYRNALDRYTLEIPAGKLDEPGEDMKICAERELEEETGFKAGKMEFLMNLNTTIAFCDEAIGLYLATELIPTEQHLDPDEDITVEAWDLADLKKEIFAGNIRDSKTVAAIMGYAAKIQG